MSHSDVFVIGAGPAGLTAAYLLTKSGISTTVIEADPTYVGGISRTASYKDFLFDIGGHRFFSKSKEVVDLWKEILPDDFIERPRLSRIYYNGKLFSYPLKAFEALNNLGYVESALCVLSFLQKQAFPTANPENFHDWVANQFGERLFSIFFKTYTEKVWGMSCDEISADWAAQRIKGLDLWSAMSNALRNSLPRAAAPKKGGQQIKTLIEFVPVPAQGPRHDVGRGGGQDQAARRPHPHGHAAREPALERAHGHAGPSASSRPMGEWKPFSARHVISSAPIRELVGSIRPQPACKAAAENLRYRDFLTVALIVDKPDLFPDNWIYIHEPSVKVGRIQNFRSWSPEMVPDAKLACLGLEYFCFEGDGLWNASDAELIALAKKELAIIGLADRGRGQGRLRRAPEEGLSGLRRELQGERRDDPQRAGRALPDPAPRRPQRHAQVQQPGPRHDDGHADRQEHHGRARPSTTSGTSTRTPSTTRPARPASARRSRACAWCRPASARAEPMMRGIADSAQRGPDRMRLALDATGCRPACAGSPPSRRSSRATRW